MSGGVDSSVAAALLKNEGYDVVGVFMRFWTLSKIARINADLNADSRRFENKCCSVEAYHDALAVADRLGIKLYTFNFEKEFKKLVVDYFIKSLKKGETPNPCVVCNKEIKSKLLLNKVLKLGGDYVASGHYVQKRQILNSKPEILNKSKILNSKSKTYIHKLLKAKDDNKDQSYFLWTMKPKQIERFLFPIGDYKKEEVRKIAKKLKLPVFQKRDSEDLCFIGDHLGGFIDRYVKSKSGDIVDTKNNILGKHKGLALYTIGQRKDIGLPAGPWYVYKKDIKNNRLMVVHERDKKLLFSDKLTAKSLNWISGRALKFPIEVTAKIRYQHKGARAVIEADKRGSKRGTTQNIVVKFKKPQLAVTSGQSVVFYKGRELLGGGVIM